MLTPVSRHFTIIKFWGGLGNQMFQFALYKALKKNRPAAVRADLSWYSNNDVRSGFELGKVFNITLDTTPDFIAGLYNGSNRKWHLRKLRRLFGLKSAFITERYPFAYDAHLFADTDGKFFSGYWQNPEYFSLVADDLKQDFAFKNPLSEFNRAVLNKINSCNSISIHVRRGDYLEDSLLGGICNIQYYSEAVKLLRSQVKLPEFFIFSDDIGWCKANLELDEANFISWNTQSDSFVDMQLMSNCKYNILANSSFSWWAAWLNEYEKKIVVAPQKWVNDISIDTSTLTPPSWNRI